MELVPNNKGGHKLLYEDYTEMARVIRSSAHSHDGSKLTVAAIKVRTTLKDRASTSRGTPAQLIADHTASVPV
ncbi:hypothetical protein LSH36_130g03037 [Paralvinella palmiformis]|uniref:Uncharacterized protein n=1 Tax=Paralvinella palmiformis TaxID=53620 RepID=A0AAD9JWZ3_9ANNE|nr:hypothetical protein LSH36_130g03037 [Paralvinella palmiformis]